jgi:hypothetical protein
VGAKSKAQKDYRNRKDALLEGCVEEIQERIPVGFIRRGGGRTILTVDTIPTPLSFYLLSYILILRPQRKYRSEEADPTCSPGLNQLPTTKAYLLRQFWEVCITLTDIQYDAMYNAEALCGSSFLSIFKPSQAIFKINSYLYDMLLSSSMQVEF